MRWRVDVDEDHGRHVVWNLLKRLYEQATNATRIAMERITRARLAVLVQHTWAVAPFRLHGNLLTARSVRRHELNVLLAP